MTNLDYSKALYPAIKDLPERQKTIITRRFGLESGERETLEKIGEDFGITRERVRQVESDGFKKLENKKKDKEIQNLLQEFQEFLKEKGKLKREYCLLEEMKEKETDHPWITFLLTWGEDFIYFFDRRENHSFWGIEKGLDKKVKEVAKELEEFFQKKNSSIPSEEFGNLANKHREGAARFFSIAEVVKNVGRGPLGQIGLTRWPEIKPNGVKDRAYLTLKKEGRPLHFREITDGVNKLEGEYCRRKNALSQTVHNEVIRDDRFVLVGRGIYALKEWNYQSGTVKDIITRLLKENGSLSKEEILKKTKNQRRVRESTILLNLGDTKYFEQDLQGNFHLKESS